METQEKSLEELQEILAKLNLLKAEEAETASMLLAYLHNSLDVFKYMFRNGYTEEQPSHVINYCIMKLEFAKKQIENEEVEEGLAFTKSVIMFFIKETTLAELTEEPETF
ncbi:hypothetical protein [Rufibacter hautae]|uniref:Uncharacterized protein n=1 Tax=Rufibacter hautae TaxID=2595005 RepID=A0A5B6TD03_9BACT|nr:hypothetical protein [Rufibacter hautae]KAA3438339.1 hypothetical protein FOA19_13905 [Rufibacter hautae]